MAKELQLTQLTTTGLRKEFNLIGSAKVGEKTFALDVESSKENSDWVYSRLNLGINCGNDGTIYSTMQGGFGTARDNKVRTRVKTGQDENGKNTYSEYIVDWEDRLDEDILKDIPDNSFIKIGILKDDEDKTVVEKFLTPYDAIKYLKDNLEDGMVLNVKGNLKYKIWNEKVTCEKEIKSIFLSKAEKENFRAAFVQTIFIDDKSIGKLDKDTRTIPITGYIVDYISEYEGQKLKRLENGKEKNGLFLPLMKTFNFNIGEDKDKALKMLKQFKAKSKKEVDRITVDGKFSRGSVDTVSVTIDDIQDKDILEMIELGYIKADDVLNQMAKANNQGSSPEVMIIENPKVKFVENKATGMRIPQLDKLEKAYSVENFSIPMLIKTFNFENGAEVKEKEKEISENEALNQVLNNLDDDSEDNWLDNLDD